MLGRKTLILFAGQWINYAVQLASSILIARALGPEMNGKMGFAFGAIGLFMMLTGLGAAQAHQKRVAEGQPIPLCMGTYTAILLSLNLTAVLLCGIFWNVISPKFHTTPEKHAFFLFLAYQMMLTLSNVFIYTFYARGEIAKAGFAGLLSKIARLFLVVCVIFLSPNLRGVALAMIGEALVLIGMCWRMSAGYGRMILPTWQSLKSYWAYTKPLAVTAPFGVLGDSADRVIGGMHWHMAQLGHYNIARNFLGIAKNVPSAGVTVLFPRMAALYAEGRHEELHRTFYEGIRKLLLLMTPLVVLGIAFSKLGVRMLYGAEFLPASTAINGFLIMVWLNTLLTPYHFLVYAIEKHQKFAYIMPISQLLYIAAFFIVTGAWSPFGLGTAAFVNCIPNVVPMIVVAGLCLKHTGISFDWSIWRFLAAGLLMYLPFAIITPYWQGAGGLFLATPLSVGLYILGVFRLRKMIKSDISYFLDLIHPHRLYQYVRGEISQA